MQVWSLGQEDSPGEGNGSPLQYSCLGNPMNRGAWWAIVHRGCKELDTTEWLILPLFTFFALVPLKQEEVLWGFVVVIQSVSKSCPNLCDSVDCSMPGFPILHYLLGFASASVFPVNIQGWFPYRIDWFDLLAVQRTLKSLLQHHSLKASILWHSALFRVQLSKSVHDQWKNHCFGYMGLCRQSNVSAF